MTRKGTGRSPVYGPFYTIDSCNLFDSDECRIAKTLLDQGEGLVLVDGQGVRNSLPLGHSVSLRGPRCTLASTFVAEDLYFLQVLMD